MEPASIFGIVVLGCFVVWAAVGVVKTEEMRAGNPAEWRDHGVGRTVKI